MGAVVTETCFSLPARPQIVNWDSNGICTLLDYGHGKERKIKFKIVFLQIFIQNIIRSRLMTESAPLAMVPAVKSKAGGDSSTFMKCV